MRRAPLLLFCFLAVRAAAQLPTPADYLGYPVGADRKLAPYSRVLDYLRQVAVASPRVSIELAGKSTLGNDLVTVVLTSESNQNELARYRHIASRLANPDEIDHQTAFGLIDEGKAIVLVTCTIHSTEVGCTQMAMEFVHEFATTQDPLKLSWMEDIVLLLMPSINPDGQVLVIDWYEKYLGSEYEGGPMPWLYHHFVGHDNNRDFYMLTQKESRVLNDVLYHRWLPQVFVDQHQMGSTGPRMFVPPQTDPLAAEVDSLIFRQADLIGTHMAYRLEEAGKLGVGHNMIYDSYWPGGTRNTAWWKNVTGLLTEVASARLATPIFIEPGELRGGRKGLPEYKRRANFPSPWPGGWWRLRDIVDYERIATWALLESCSQYRRELLQNFYAMGMKAVKAGRTQSPTAWIVTPDQHDPVAAGLLIELLLRHGVRVERAAGPISVGRTAYPEGTQVIPAAQPYRAFLLTMLRPQRYPEVLPYVGGPVIPPYDVTAWSLPILMGVDVVEATVEIRGDLSRIDSAAVWPDAEVREAPGGYLIPHRADSAYTAINRLLQEGKRIFWLADGTEDQAPGEIYIPADQIAAERLTALARELHLPVRSLTSAPSGKAFVVGSSSIGLYKPWVASIDEGWTRWLLERYEFPYLSLNNDDLKENSFVDKIDLLLFPDLEKSVIETGAPSSPQERRFQSPLPPEYSGGIGPEGGGHIKEWVEQGGTVVALDSSTDYFIDLFSLPVVNVLTGVESERFSAPGSMLRLLVDNHHPLGFGLRREEAGYFANSPAFRTAVPDARFGRRVIARYPDHRDDVLLSGYLRGAELLERRAAVVEFEVGRGRVVLLGFRVQHRAQPHRTFKLLFNALYLPALRETSLPADS